MGRSRFIAVICSGISFGPLLLLQAQEPPAKQVLPVEQSQSAIKGIKGKLHLHKPADEVLDSLKTLEALADEVQGMQFQVGGLLGHPDPNVRVQAARTLAASSQRPDIAPLTVEFLTKRLDRETNAEVVAWLLRSLARMGPYAKPEIPKFIEALKNPDPGIRRGASAVFWPFRQSDDLIPAAISALDDPDLGPDEKTGGGSVSWSAMIYLWGRRAAAKDAAPGLIKIAKSEKGDDHHRLRALCTLAAVAPTERLPLLTAREWLKKRDDVELLTKATGVLSELGVHAKEAVPDLIALANIQLFEDRAAELQAKLSIIDAFGRIGPAAKAALPTLEMLAMTKSNIVRGRALEAIKRVQAKE